MANFELSVMLSMLFVIGYYGYLVSILKDDLFSYQGAMKSLFIILNFWLLLVPIALAIEIISFNSGTNEMINLVSTLYTAMISINILLTMWFLIITIFGMYQSVLSKREEEA